MTSLSENDDRIKLRVPPSGIPSEGFYVGLAGNTKQSWALLYRQPIGRVLGAFGKYLYDNFGRDDKDGQLAEALKEEIDGHRHSGASILVELQQLLDLLGARCLDDTTRNYLLNMPKSERKEVSSR